LGSTTLLRNFVLIVNSNVMNALKNRMPV